MAGSAPPIERGIITVLAADIVGSTSHIADCDPEEAQILFDRWFERLREAVDSEGGTLVSYEGDGGIAAFGWPTSLEDHADRACAAAWDIQRLNPPDLGPDGRPVRFRVGVHSGLAAMRQVTRDGRSYFNTVGATVHIAAKLQQCAPPGEVLISDQTAMLCRSRLSVTPQEPSPALAALQTRVLRLDARPEALDHRDLARRYRSPMIGRHPERAALREALPRAGGHSATVALIGEPGVGKSRLAVSLIAETLSQGARVLVFFGDTQKRTTPFAAARSLIRELLQVSEPVSAERLSSALAATALDAGPTAALMDLLAPSPGGGRTAKLTQIQLARACAAAFGKLVADRPTLLLVEDLHLLDPESSLFLRLLAAGAPPQPLCLMLTGRPEALQTASDIGATILQLDPLPAKDMLALGRQIWPQGRYPTAMLERMVARADGVPFVLEELIRSVEDEAPPAFQALPQTVGSVIHARLQRLSPSARATAQTLSLLGENVDLGVAADMLEGNSEQLKKDLSELERFAFIHPVTRHSTHMRHQIIAEACAETIPRERRKQMHRAALAAIVARSPALEGRHEQLAYHAEAAGDDMAALEHLWNAALAARRSSAAASLNLTFDRAADLASRIGERADQRSVDFLLMAFASMVQLGEFAKVNRHLPRVMALVREGGRPELVSSTLSQLGMLCWFEGRYEEGLRATEEGLAIARGLNSPALIFSNQIMQTNILHGMGRVERAIAEEQALCDLLTGDLETARLGAAGGPRVTALGFMSWFLVDVGRYAEGLDFAQRAFDLAVREQDTYGELLARNALGRNLLLLRRDEQAADCLGRGRELSDREGYDAIQPNLTGREAHALARIGRAEEAIGRVEDTLARGLHLRTGRLEVFNLTAGHAEALYRAGQTGPGLDRLDEALTIARSINNPCLMVDALGLRARLLTETSPDDPRVARDTAERLSLCRRYGLADWPAALD